MLSWLPITVLVLGVLSGGGFLLLNHLNTHHRQYDALIDVVYEIDRQASLAHLWLDEKEDSEAALVWPLLDEASAAADGLAKKFDEDSSLLTDHARQRELLVKVLSVKELLHDLQATARQLQNTMGRAGDDEIEHHFDTNFRLFSHAILEVEEIMKQDSSSHIRTSLAYFQKIFVGWIFLVMVLLLALLRVESRRISTSQALAESEEKFRTMADSARDAIVLADGHGDISYLNQAARRMFGKSEIEQVNGNLCTILMPEGPQTDAQDRCANLWKDGVGSDEQTTICEILVCTGGREFPVEVSLAPIELDGSQQNIAILRDISERKEAEKALRENELLLRTLINAMPDFVCFKDGEGRWLMANEFGLRLFGLDGVDYRGKTDLELAEVNEFFRPAFHYCIRSDEEAWQKGTISRCDEMVPRQEGKPYTYDVLKVPLFNPDHSRRGLLVIGRDITQRKDMEQALQDSEEQLRHLSASLFVVQESERRRVANELHDELGQALVALKMQVRSLQRRLEGGGQEEGQECDTICDYINEIIENVRRLSRDLSPVVLDDLGLGAAIKHMVDKFSELHDIDCSCSMEDFGQLLAPGAERIVYRIVQEGLTNIAKHASARNIEITANRMGRGIRFIIRDDGCGFDPEAVMQKKAAERGLGLTAMSERMRMLGGVLDIESQPGYGTTLSMLVPVHSG